MTAGNGVVRMWELLHGLIAWRADIRRNVLNVKWKDDRLVVMSIVYGPRKSLAGGGERSARRFIPLA